MENKELKQIIITLNEDGSSLLRSTNLSAIEIMGLMNLQLENVTQRTLYSNKAVNDNKEENK